MRRHLPLEREIGDEDTLRRRRHRRLVRRLGVLEVRAQLVERPVGGLGLRPRGVLEDVAGEAAVAHVVGLVAEQQDDVEAGEERRGQPRVDVHPCRGLVPATRGVWSVGPEAWGLRREAVRGIQRRALGG